MTEIVLVSNGPGELYTWVKPVLAGLREHLPNARIAISLIPCQFASGQEAEIARTFGADVVTTPAEYVSAAARRRAPAALGSGTNGLVVGLGGNPGMAVQLGKRLGYPVHRYTFETDFQAGTEAQYVPDVYTRNKAIERGAPPERVHVIGNLVADATEASVATPGRGSPHVLLFSSSRSTLARHFIPFLLGIVDELGKALPNATFAWPISRLLSPDAVQAGIAGPAPRSIDGVHSTRSGNLVTTASGITVHIVPEDERYNEMRAADIAITMPGTNTLELGIAHVPAAVLLPLNRAELIPVGNALHWVGYIPLVGPRIKSWGIRWYINKYGMVASLPNRITNEDLMYEIAGTLDYQSTANRILAWLSNPADLERRRAGLQKHMPKPGAVQALTKRLVQAVQPQ